MPLPSGSNIAHDQANTTQPCSMGFGVVAMIAVRPRWPFALIALAAMACGPSGPSRFAPDDLVGVKGGGRAKAVSMATAPGVGSFGDFEGIDNGTAAAIVEDAEADDANQVGARRVRIKILEGEHKGMTGTVRRDELVPLK
jgi:hypothetical protein